MIKSFADKESEKIWNRQRSRTLPFDIQERALRKMIMLHVAINLDDLRNPPCNKLELLQGDLHGNYSIRINNQWRLCFRWEENNAFDVKIIDYH